MQDEHYSTARANSYKNIFNILYSIYEGVSFYGVSENHEPYTR